MNWYSSVAGGCQGSCRLIASGVLAGWWWHWDLFIYLYPKNPTLNIYNPLVTPSKYLLWGNWTPRVPGRILGKLVPHIRLHVALNPGKQRHGTQIDWGQDVLWWSQNSSCYVDDNHKRKYSSSGRNDCSAHPLACHFLLGWVLHHVGKSPVHSWLAVAGVLSVSLQLQSSA